MSGHENIYKPSAHPDLDWINRDTVVWQSAGSAARNEAFRKKEAEQNCENKLGHSLENEVQNLSPNATNLAR